MATLLEVRDLSVAYGAIEALRGISLSVEAGQVVALIGANGAGKTTTLRAISGMLKSSKGSQLRLDGEDIAKLQAHELVARGLAHAPEGRGIFLNLTVRENLELGAFLRRDRPGITADMEKAFTLFPILRERAEMKSGTLSGGEQQMLAISRALMARPKLILLDEPSLGLAPLLVKEIFGIVQRINAEEKTTFLLVEQNANLALSIAHYGYVMENGRIVLDGDAEKLRSNEDVKEFYMGGGAGKSYKNLKFYKRRKRWLS